MRFQSSWNKTDIPTPESRLRVESIVRRALELGINHIETAHGYGTSEEELGYFLPDLPRDSFILQTKVQPRKSLEPFHQEFEESLRLLRVDYLDLFGLHGINNEEVLHNTLCKGGALEAALRLKEEGRVRHVGFSTHGPTSIILSAIRSGGFDYVNLHWYYIFQDNWPAIEEAHRRDMGVFIISPSDKGGMLYNPPEKLKRLTSPLSPVVFNDLFCLSRPEVHTLSVGASRPENFEEHLLALKCYEQRGDLLPPIVERLQEEARRTLGENWIDSWKEGLPSWQETPGGINIPVILHLWNLAKAYDLIEYGKMRYNLMGNGGHWFPGSRPVSLDTLDFARCLKRSAHAGRIPAILKEADDPFAGERVKRLGKEEG
jgi:hypothetical protein